MQYKVLYVLFIKFAILPELEEKLFSKESFKPLPQSLGDDKDTASSSNKVVIVEEEKTVMMTGCDNKECPIEWLHYSCLKMIQNDMPKGSISALSATRIRNYYTCMYRYMIYIFQFYLVSVIIQHVFI